MSVTTRRFRVAVVLLVSALVVTLVVVFSRHHGRQASNAESCVPAGVVASEAAVLDAKLAHPVFPAASAFWDPLPRTVQLDPNSAAIAAAIASPSAQHIVNVDQFAVPVYTATATTPRYRVTVTNEGLDGWGDDALAHGTVPIPNGAVPASGSDHKLVIVDPRDGEVYDLWQAARTASGWSASWGGVYPLRGDGSSRALRSGASRCVSLDIAASRSTGSGLSSAVGIIRISEMQARSIPHALVFSTDIACGPPQSSRFRWPATTTDGASSASACIAEGARVQLDPAIDLATIPGVTPGELTIGRALQTYGAYVEDNGGARMAFVAELPHPGDPDPYPAAGLSGDYVQLTHLPWASLRVLGTWDG